MPKNITVPMATSMPMSSANILPSAAAAISIQAGAPRYIAAALNR
jgi:hypothetical protein